MRQWLKANPEDRKDVKGGVRLSNLTDNESAKMATGKGVIQGYTGVAAVDEAHQVIVDAQAHGTGSEQELLVPVVEATQTYRTPETIYTRRTPATIPKRAWRNWPKPRWTPTFPTT